MIDIVRIIAVLVAAGLLGNWYLAEYKKAHRLGKPWYYAFLSIPGVLVILIIALPVIYHFFF